MHISLSDNSLWVEQLRIKKQKTFVWNINQVLPVLDHELLNTQVEDMENMALLWLLYDSSHCSTLCNSSHHSLSHCILWSLKMRHSRFVKRSLSHNVISRVRRVTLNLYSLKIIS